MGKSYEDLRVWHTVIDLAVKVYALTKTFPQDEKYGITNQMRRSSVSVSSNIAEGCSRGSANDFIRFLNISSGSLAEVKTQLIISSKIGYLGTDKLKDMFLMIDEIAKMLNALKKSVRIRNQQPVTSNQ